MKKTTISCDCCGKEMSDATGAEMRAQLRDRGIRFEMDGELDMPTTDLVNEHQARTTRPDA